jgi:hypothetical protein
MRKIFAWLGAMFGFWIFLFMVRDAGGVPPVEMAVGFGGSFAVAALCLSVIVPVVLAISAAGGSNTVDALKRAVEWMRGKR